MQHANLHNILPPRQQLAAPGKWPVVGEREPKVTSEPWTISVLGCVVRPHVFSLAELRALPQVERMIEIHCVTRWSKLGVTFRGVLLSEVLKIVRPTNAANFVSFVARSERNHDTSLPLSKDMQDDVLLVFMAEGKPLEEIHGGPIRVVTPGRYFYKSLKWLERIELLAEDRLGYWERTAGYHNGADPAKEERYFAVGLSRSEAAALLAARMIAGQELLNLSASGLELNRLNARSARLRNADFRNCKLQHACFDGANLTNGRFEGADLQNASFLNSDVEGADFSNANLTGCSFQGASLLAATFSPGVKIDGLTEVVG